MLSERDSRNLAEDISHHAKQALYEFQNAAYEMQRPSVIFKPLLSKDGNEWCALLGENLQEGLAAFGKSPAEAMSNFDKAWFMKEANQ